MGKIIKSITNGIKGKIVLSYLLVICKSAIPLLYAEALRRMIDSMQSTAWNIARNMLIYATLILGIQIACNFVTEHVRLRISGHIGARLRTLVINSVMNSELQGVSQIDTSVLLTKYNVDVESVRKFVAEDIFNLTTIMLSFIFAVRYIFQMQVVFLPICAIPALAAFFVVLLINKKIKPSEIEYVNDKSHLMGLYTDICGGLVDIKVNQAEDKFQELNNNITDAYAKSKITREWLEEKLTAVSMAQHGITTILLLTVGILLVYLKKTTTGDVIAAYSIFYMIANPLKNMSRYWGLVTKGTVALERIAEVYALRPERCGGNRDFAEAISKLEADDLKFSYNGRNDGFQLQVGTFNMHLGGLVYAVVGQSGSGKTTFAKLLSGYSEAYTGTLKYRGVEIKEADIEKLREQVLYVSNEYAVYPATIIENVLGENDSQELFNRLMAIVELDDYVNAFPLKAHHLLIGDNTLSGGQRQRLLIARALSQEADIYVFDEMFSAIGIEQAQRIIHNMRRLYRNATFIIVTHELALARNADYICCFRQGKFEGIGSHEEMMETSNGYRELAESVKI